MFWGVIYLFEYGIALLRIFLLISLVCFAPRIFFIRESKSFIPSITSSSVLRQAELTMLTPAVVHQWCPGKHEPKIALITYCNGQTQMQDTLINTVWHIDDLMLAPHDTYKDQVHSLCTAHDLMLIDIPSVGLSFAYASHFLFDILDNAAAHNIPVAIYDRPNMLGKKIEGPVSSFMRGTRCFKLPFCHGMTVAELAHYYNTSVLENKVALHIVSLNNYNRADSWTQKFYDEATRSVVTSSMVCGIVRQIAPLSNADSLNHHNCIMLPPHILFLDKQWYQLQALLKEFGIASFLYRYTDKDSEGAHRGLKLEIGNIDEVDCFKAILAIIDFFKAADVPLFFSEQFDRSMGSSLVRQYAKGMLSQKKVFACINKDLELFYRSAFAHFMYYPLPQLSLM